jgi:ribosomal protein L16 Arg81 hydroxylase
LLAPLEPAAFFRDVWERQHHVVERGAPGYYGDLLALDDVDALIGLSGMLVPPCLDFRLVKKGDDGLQVRPATEQAIGSLQDVYQAYADGFTVILNRIERHWAPVAALCRDLATVFRCRVGANLYLTPRQAQGFTPHYDTHDVFILQLAGTKTWRLYGALTPLPLPGPLEERAVPPEQLGPPTAECRLADGDLLYLPRGHVHEAATATESSLHLTVGIHVTRWADLLSAAVMQAAERDVALRGAVPPEWLRGEATAEPVIARLQEMLGLVAADVPTGSVLADWARRQEGARPPALEGHFRSLDRLPELTPDTRVRRRAGLSCTVVVENGSAALHFGGTWVAGPERIARPLRFVAATETFRVAELPGLLDDRGKVVLVRRLVREGLLSVEPPEEDTAERAGRAW